MSGRELSITTTAGTRARAGWVTVAGASVGALVALEPAVAALPLLLGATGAAVAALARWTSATWQRRERYLLFKWTALAFAAHLLIGLTITVFTGGWRYFGPDAMQYHVGAETIAAHWSGETEMPALPAGKEGFFFLLAAFYWAFGSHLALGIIVNAGLAAGLVPLLCDCTRRLWGTEAARHVAPLVTLAPTFLIWPSQLLREAGALFLLAVVAACVVRLTQRWQGAAVATMVTALALLSTFRGFVALFVAAAVLVSLTISRRNVAAGLSTAMVTSLLLVVLVAGAGIGRSGYEATLDTGFERANAARTDLSTSAESGFDETRDISSPGGAVSYLPIGLVRLFLGPFPWQVGSFRQLPGLLDAMVIWALVPSLVRGLRAARRRLRRTPFELLLPPAGLAAILGLVIGNFGTLLRERAQVFVFLVPVIALGVAEADPRKGGTASFLRRLTGPGTSRVVATPAIRTPAAPIESA